MFYLNQEFRNVNLLMTELIVLMYEIKSLEMWTRWWQSLIVPGWPCAVDRIAN